jgi:hypothetical protein
MNRNDNFYNQYDCFVVLENREKAIKLLDKLKVEKPEVYREADIKIKQEGTSLYINFNNMAAFDESTTTVIKRWFNSINSYC